MTHTGPARPVPPAPAGPAPRTVTALRAAYAVCVAGGVVGVGTMLAPLTGWPVEVGPAVAVIAVQAVLIGLVIRHSIRRADRARVLGRGPLLLAAAWGAFPAVAGPGWLTTALEHLSAGALGARTARTVADTLTAPVVEEAGKALAVLAVALLVRGAVATPAHGALLGAVSGLGFQVVENLSYAGTFAADTGSALGTLNAVGGRLLVGLWSMHWVFSAVAGIAVALLLGRSALPPARRRLAAAGAAVLAVALHVLNNLGSLDGPAGLTVVGAVGGAGVFSAIALLTVVRPVLARAASD